VSRRRALALLLLALAAPPATAGGRECEASASVEPARPFVGQPVLWRLEILRAEDVARVAWLEPPVFPDFRAEWLPSDLTAEPRTLGGTRRIATRERRMLFPARAGALVIPEAALACEAEGGAGARRLAARVAATRVDVQALPDAGRPADFDGVVGPVEVAQRLVPESIALGETAWLSVQVRGSGALWSIRDPLLAAEPPPGIEVFPEPPDVARDIGRSLQLRRSFRYALVPRREGRIPLPEIRVAWFDPATRSYRIARAPGRELVVGPPASAPARGARAVSPPEPARPASGASRLLAFAALVALALAAGAALVRRRRPALPRRTARAALRRARAAAATGDRAAALAACEAALRGAVAARMPGAGALAADELQARAAGQPALEAAAALLAELERARFAAGAAGVDPERVERAVLELCSAP
jgi:hypothetical protein